MNLRVGAAGLMFFLLLLFATLCPGQGEYWQTIEELRQNGKLIESQLLLEDFVKGKETTRVVVNLSDSPGGRKRGNFGDPGFRKSLHTEVKAAQDGVINRLDPTRNRVTNRFVYIFGFSAEVDLASLYELAAMEEVVSINKDRVLEAQLAQGIPLINGETVRNTYNGSGLAIAICDTGVDTSHPMLGGGGFPNVKVIGGYDTGDDDSDPRPDPLDGHPHGTKCAGIAAGSLGSVGDYIGGVAHEAKLYALKISYGNTGSAYESDMIEAWEWCVIHQDDDEENPIMIISTSFGGGHYTSTCDSASPAMTAAAANGAAVGITIFAASGNNGFCDATIWPACIGQVNAVGAVYDADIGRYPPEGSAGCISQLSCAGNPSPPCDVNQKWYVDDPTKEDQVTTYSNSASFLSLLAPSNKAYTTDIAGEGGSNPGDYGFLGGTSAACPYAAGAAACLQGAANSITGSFLTPAEVRSLLTTTGEPITDDKVDITKPRVNLGAAIDALWSMCTPVIDDISYDDCISEESACVSVLNVTAYDPCGGDLSYAYDPVDGGNIFGSGAEVLFDPPGPSQPPNCQAYRVVVRVTSSASNLSSAQVIGVCVRLGGDVDGDGIVNVVDKVMVRNFFGESGPPGWTNADVDCDGIVNVVDKVIVRNQFGQTGCSCPP